MPLPNGRIEIWERYFLNQSVEHEDITYRVDILTSENKVKQGSF